jgi:NAD(P)H dehydrogenase (quinone)
MSKLLLTGAAGQLGRATLDALIASGKVAASDIVAVTRDTAKLADYAAKGVDVRAGDFDKPETLPAAFAGADRVAIISIDFGDRVRRHKAAIDAARAAGASRLLYTSLPRIDGVPVTFGDDHFGTEDVIAESGLAYTILRNNWYAENVFLHLPNAIRSGQWFTSAHSGRATYAPRASMAEALAAALLEDGDESKIYTLTGTGTYSAEDVAALANKVLGTGIAVVNISDEQLAEGMKQAGLPDFLVPILVSMDTNIRNGGLDIVTDDIKTLTGKAPGSLESFLVAHKEALLAAAR